MSLESTYNHLKTLCSQWFYLKNEITTLLGGKVDKVNGKGLSANDFTDTLKSKLDGIAASANNYTHPSYTTQSKKLYKIEVDSTGHVSDVTQVQKSDITDLGIPGSDTTYTAASDTPSADTTSGSVGSSAKYAREDHTHPKSTLYAEASHNHSAGEMTDSTAHSNINTSAGATQAAINSAIDSKIGSLLSVELLEVVSTRPTASASTMNKLYMVPETSSASEDVYEIFVTVRNGTSGSYTYSWEKVDTARIDLSGYATTSAVETALSGKAASTHTHGNITNAGKIGSTAGKLVVTGGSGDTAGILDVSDMVTEFDSLLVDLIAYGSD